MTPSKLQEDRLVFFFFFGGVSACGTAKRRAQNRRTQAELQGTDPSSVCC
jgi:hypothetical protein